LFNEGSCETTEPTNLGHAPQIGWSYDALDRDTAMQEEVRNAARSLVQAVKQSRRGELKQPDAGLREPRPK
jgi:hypothetical protein